MIRRVRKAIFPVGGMGTRFLPATKAMPKEMLPVVDKPVIQYAVEEARAAGITHCIFVTGRGKSAIEDHFDYSYELHDTLVKRGKDALWNQINENIPQPGQVAYIRQQEALGLGHAVWCARDLIGDEPFAVLLADDLVLSERSCLKQMLDAYETTGGNLIAASEVPREKISAYGVFDPESVDGPLVKAKSIVEKPKVEDAPSNYAAIGRYILQPEIFGYLERVTPGSGGEIQLTDAIALLMKQQTFYGYLFEGKRFDCGSKIGFLEANLAFGLHNKELADGIRDFLPTYQES